MTSFDWPEFLELARTLSRGTGEAAHRTAISRAYYYVYHLAQQRALRNGLVLNWDDSQHKKTWQFSIASPDFSCKQVGLLGQRLKERRVKADYKHVYGGRIAEELADTFQAADGFAAQLGRLDPRLPK